MVQLVLRIRKVKTKMYSSQPRMKVKTAIARMPFLHLRQHHVHERLAPRGAVGQRAHLDVPGHGVEEALHDEDGEGQLEGDEHQDDAVERVEQPDPVEHQEHRHDQRQHREGVQHQQRAQHRGAAGKLEAREVVGGERGDGDDDRGLRAGDQERVAEGVPDVGELHRAVDLADARAHHRGEVRLHQEDEVAAGAGRGRPAARRRPPRRARPRPCRARPGGGSAPASPPARSR